MSIRPNRDHWNARSDRYQAIHGTQLARAPKAWGGWQVPESEVNALGDLAALRVLELGCGAGQWSAALADDGVSVIGLDLSERQLTAAKQHMRAGYPLVQAAAEEIPFVDSSLDVVFCDHGALGWGDPYRVVPEVARVLRSGGRLVFSVSSPWLLVCYEEETDRVGTTLHRAYFDLDTQNEDDGAQTYSLTYGQWVRLFRRNGLLIEDLIEPRPSADATTTYYSVEPSDWAHRFPPEMLWVTRRD